MTCPVCGGSTRVITSLKDCEGVYRSRKCIECGHSFYTNEYESDGSEFLKLIREERARRRK